MAIDEPPRPQTGRSEPPPPQQGRSAAERGPQRSELERELTSDKSLISKIFSAANPRLFFGIVSEYPAGIKQFLWLCLGILYIPWLILLAFAWPIVKILDVLGFVLFEIWWFLTGWFWRKLGGEKPLRGKAKRAAASKAAAGE